MYGAVFVFFGAIGALIGLYVVLHTAVQCILSAIYDYVYERMNPEYERKIANIETELNYLNGEYQILLERVDKLTKQN